MKKAFSLFTPLVGTAIMVITVSLFFSKEKNRGKEKRASRGFSLFTPLVGTAIMVITVIIASTIIQNDIRFADAITNSYIISSSTLISRGIESDVGSIVGFYINKAMIDDFDFAIITIKCDGTKEKCITAGKTTFETDIASSIISQFKSNFYNVVDEVISMAGQGWIAQQANRQTIIDTIALTLSAEEIAAASFDLDGYYVVQLKSDYLMENYQKELSLDFNNSVTGEMMKIPIIPSFAKARSNLPIEKILEETAVYLDSGTFSPDVSLSGKVLKNCAQTDGANHGVKTVWRYATVSGNIKKLTIIMQTGDMALGYGC